MSAVGIAILLLSCSSVQNQTAREPVDYVNPYMGNISHLLVPTFPTIHLPHSMLRVYPNAVISPATCWRGSPSW